MIRVLTPFFPSIPPVNDGRSSTKRNYLGLRNAFKTIWIEEGIRGFYRGLVPNSLGAGLSWGLYFLL